MTKSTTAIQTYIHKLQADLTIKKRLMEHIQNECRDIEISIEWLEKLVSDNNG